MRDDDDDIQDYESGWRKRQISAAQNAAQIRNDTLEEVAKEIEKMTAFGQDTLSSFSVYIRSMKR